jgi:crossover junction endodeoxyribonuclease RusA
MKEPIQFFVAGTPKPAGSKRAFYIKKPGRAIITDACAKSKDWKSDVRSEAQKAYSGELWCCPISLTLHFFVVRPKSHFRSGINSEKIKESAPRLPVTKPDVDKLSRAVMDALTGVVWRDDSLVVSKFASKRYHANPGVEIRIDEA